MKQIIAAVAVTLGLVSLSACGSSHTGSGPVPAMTGQQTANGQSTVRHTRSSPCTEDSYGYCLHQEFQGQNTWHSCVDGYSHYFYKLYYLYHNGAFVEQYDWYSNDCDGNPFWSPSDPASDTGDPLLP
jgi:hypothetical protein